MHPRNVFLKRPDYTDLAIKYPDFRKVCKLKLDGNVCIDYKHQLTLVALSRTLLREYFQLEVEFAPGSLIPTIPQRLNYILWLEDLLGRQRADETNPVRGIDIGCGSSCIYSLLAARKNHWTMVALETNETNLSYAKENIRRNKLESLISLYAQQDNRQIFSEYFNDYTMDAKEEANRFDFCLCNPPFYDLSSSALPMEEQPSKRKKKRPPPNNCPTGFQEELSCDGGEVQFVQNIINESIQFQDRIRIFTSLLGHKSSLEKIIDSLKSHNIGNYTSSQFKSGKTMRWTIAWSFSDQIQLDSKRQDNVDGNDR